MTPVATKRNPLSLELLKRNLRKLHAKRYALIEEVKNIDDRIFALKITIGENQ